MTRGERQDMQVMHGMRRWVVSAAAAVMAVGSVLVVSGGPAGALGVPGFSLQPVSTPGAIHPRGSFHYDLKPGQTINDAVVLSNETSTLEQFQLWPTDGYNTKVGGAFALRPYGYKMTGMGTWVNLHLGHGIYGLPGHTSVTIHFSLTVPANATPGDHAGGIEALDVTPVAQPKKGPAHFVVHQGIATAIFVRVAGPVHPSAAVSDISVKSSTPMFGFGSSHADVTFQIENTGNTVLSGKAHVTVTNLFGQTVKTFTATSLQKLVPGTRFTVKEPVWNSLPFIGPETVHVRFVSPGMPTATGQSTFWVLPWLLILVVILVLAALVGRIWWWPRHRRARTGTSAGPSGTSAPEPSGSDEPVHAPEPPVGSEV